MAKTREKLQAEKDMLHLLLIRFQDELGAYNCASLCWKNSSSSV